MIISAEALALMRAGVVSIVPIMFIDATTPARIAASFGTFPVAADAVDTTGGDYLGVGSLSEMPGLENLINGTAARSDFTLSAVGDLGQAMAAAFEADESDLKLAPVYVGFLLLDSALQQVGDPFWTWAGAVDKTAITKQGGSEGPIRTISLGVGTRFVRRSQGKPSYYTDFDQKLLSATDDFCRNTKGYAAETTKPWPAT